MLKIRKGVVVRIIQEIILMLRSCERWIIIITIAIVSDTSHQVRRYETVPWRVQPGESRYGVLTRSLLLITTIHNLQTTDAETVVVATDAERVVSKGGNTHVGTNIECTGPT